MKIISSSKNKKSITDSSFIEKIKSIKTNTGVNINITKEGINYTTNLVEMIDPYKQYIYGIDELNYYLHLGMIAWNAANIQTFFPDLFPEYLKSLEKDNHFKPGEFKIIKDLIKRKESLFPDNNLFVKDFEVNPGEYDSPNIIGYFLTAEEFVMEAFSNKDDDSSDDFFNDLSDDEPGCINRCAITIKPKQPFFDWLNKLEFNNNFLSDDKYNVYLVKEFDTNERIEKWLKKNFEEIFVLELEDWNTDPITWPHDRTYKMFNEWFTHEITSMVYDLEDSRVSKDL